MAENEKRSFGLPPLKAEGSWLDFETGLPPTAEQIAAAKAAREAELAAMVAFDGMVNDPPPMIDPIWLEQAMGLADRTGERLATDYLLRLVLSRIADGRVQQPEACARLMLPHGIRRFSWGW